MMKKYLSRCFIILLCGVVFLFTSCEKTAMTDGHPNQYVADDTKTAENDLTRDYDLNELRQFFEGCNINEYLISVSDIVPLTFSEVNMKFPVEIIRSADYSLYKVRQGGYYYVFWYSGHSTGSSQRPDEPVVYFSGYLSSDLPISQFDSIKPGTSTAEDVKRMDPSVEIARVLPSGSSVAHLYSFSYLNEETVLQIEYENSGSIDGYHDLIVKTINVIARTEAPSRYGLIFPGDLP